MVDVNKRGGVITHKNVPPPTPSPPFPNKKKKKNGHQQSPRFNLACTSRACSLKVLPNNSMFVETYILLFLFKTPA
jgi:hypothetical protein